MVKAIRADSVAEKIGTSYPPPHDAPCRARGQRPLASAFGLTQFGVNQVRLPPGTWSSQRHWHSHEDELVYMLEGELVLVTDAGEQVMRAGDIIGFKGGVADGHHLINRGSRDAVFLAIGSRLAEDAGYYPDIDMAAQPNRYAAVVRFTRKDGTPL